MWERAEPLVRRGDVSLDPLALRRERDARRGLTLVTRPSPELAASLLAFDDELRSLEPAQYYQPASALHLTVLSLFTATERFAPHLARLDDYRAGIRDGLAGIPAFEVDVTGVSLSTGAIVACGYPRDGTLELARERLRDALGRSGVGATLDGRYRLETAHMTLVRFAMPLGDPPRLVRALAAARGRAFGTLRVSAAELVVSDWYQSADRSEVAERFALG